MKDIVFLLLVFIIVITQFGPALYAVFLYVVLPIAGIAAVFHVIRASYHLFNPEAKKDCLAKKAKEAKEYRFKTEKEEAEKKAKIEREEEVRRNKENDRLRHRDADRQGKPYTYQIGNHGNESLAIRYGIANQDQVRNPDQDKVACEPSSTIRLQKTKRIGNSLYEVLLTDYRDRKAKAFFEEGTEYVKKFYPLEDNWSDKHADLELTLKGNGTFTLKELATFHIQKAVGS